MITHDSTFETLATAPVKQTDVVVARQINDPYGFYDDTSVVWRSSTVLMSAQLDAVGQFLGVATKKAVVKLLGIISDASVGDLFHIRYGLYKMGVLDYNYNWTGTAGASSSTKIGSEGTITNMATNPSLESGSASVEVRRNLFENPALTGGSTNANGTSIYYGSGGTGSGTLSLIDGVQTVNATAISGGYRKTGIQLSSCSKAFVNGEKYTLSVNVTNLNVPAGLTAKLFIEDYNGTSYNSSSTVITAPGVVSVTRTVSGSISSFGAWIWFESATDWSGIASISFKEVVAEAHACVLPYFSGSSNTWQSQDLVPSWVGAPNNSQSILTGVAPTNVTQTGSINKVWLSTDGPYSGQKFMRALILSDDAYASYFYTNDYSPFGVGNIASHSVMVRINRTIPVDIRFPGSLSATGWSSIINRTANMWEEAKVVGGTEDADTQRWIRPWTNSGDYWVTTPTLLDVDAHYAVSGVYDGGYFDGDTIDGGFEYISQGFFHIDSMSFDYEANSTLITMYDHMWLAGQASYTETNLSSGFVYPTTVAGLAQQMASAVGVDLMADFSSLPNASYNILVDPFATISNATLQTVIQEIAATTGTTARISDTTLVFKPYTINRSML